MRFATFHEGDRLRAGVVVGAAVHPLPEGTTVLDLVAQGPDAARRAGERAARGSPGVPLEGLRLAPPLQPPSVRDFMAFEEHVEGALAAVGGGQQVGAAWYEAPRFYFASPHALLGAHDDVPVPPGCQLLDFELEVAAVVGRDGRNLSPRQAEEHLFGYAVFNDWSARDLQRAEMTVGLGPCKGKDFASTLGPWLVTADELLPYRDSQGGLDLGMRVEVNGVRVGGDRLSNMAWSFADLLAYASRGAWVRAGDLLGSGTCGGGGCLAELWGRRGRLDPPPLRPGDVVTMTVEGIGTISNRVVSGPSAPEVPAARRRAGPAAGDRRAPAAG